MTAPANDSEALVPLTMLASAIRSHVEDLYDRACRDVDQRSAEWERLFTERELLRDIADQLDAHAGTRERR